MSVLALDVATGAVLAATLPVLIVQAVNIWQTKQVKQATRQTAEQTRPNGGTSLRDAIDRSEQMLRRLHERHDHLVERVSVIEDRVRDVRPRG